MTLCRLRVPLPDSAWIAAFSRANPDVVVEVRSRHDLDPTHSLAEVLLHVPGPGGWSEAVAALPLVDEVETLVETASSVHLRVVHRTSEFVPIFRELHLERRFPFEIRGGEAAWVLIASAPKVRALVERIRERAPEARLESVRHAHVEEYSGALTPRQADLLRRAMAAGYFEVPRRVSLSELARRLGMAASTLSEGLAIVEKKLVERWPGTAGLEDGASPT